MPKPAQDTTINTFERVGQVEYAWVPGGIPILAVTGYDPPWTLFGGWGKVTCYAVALYAKAALGLAIPNLATMENKATTIGRGGSARSESLGLARFCSPLQAVAASW